MITVVLGYPVAYLLASLEGRLKYTMTLLFVIPLLMSYIIKIYAIRSLLGSNGFLNRILITLGLIDEPLTFLIFNLQAVMLTLSVILLPFAILPLVLFTADRGKMGELVAPRWLTTIAVIIATAIVLLNAKLIVDYVVG